MVSLHGHWRLAPERATNNHIIVTGVCNDLRLSTVSKIRRVSGTYRTIFAGAESLGAESLGIGGQTG